MAMAPWPIAPTIQSAARRVNFVSLNSKGMDDIHRFLSGLAFRLPGRTRVLARRRVPAVRLSILARSKSPAAAIVDGLQPEGDCPRELLGGSRLDDRLYQSQERRIREAHFRFL